jgi:hypothetical protein
MKLRIRGNSLRLRLGPGEVARLAADGRVEERIVFGPGPDQRLVYALEASADVPEVRADYRHGMIRVQLPAALVETWARTDQVGLAGEQPLGAGASLTLLIEKDFECLDRAAEDDEAAYPHPMRGAACAPKNTECT